MGTTVTAKDVQVLRQRTGAGMMDCKKALEETGGDVDKAVEYLRKKGIAKAEKRADRAASEGAIVALVSDDARTAALVEVNSETDFVARNDEFRALAHDVATQVFGDAAFDGVVTVAQEGELMKQRWHKDAGKTVADAVKEASGKTGENVVLRRYARLKTDGVIGSYVHHNGRVAVLVDVTGGTGPAVVELARSVAQHIAAGVPKVPVDGQVNKFYEDNTLLDQKWVRDESKSIKQLVTEAGKEAGATLAVRRFVRFQMGEE
ncbi:MAG: Elongation factor Ts [Geminicoccaceae bacterium]|nr:Elongation factor Ts [Geminicoccaceae bacterium]